MAILFFFFSFFLNILRVRRAEQNQSYYYYCCYFTLTFRLASLFFLLLFSLLGYSSTLYSFPLPFFNNLSP